MLNTLRKKVVVIATGMALALAPAAVPAVAFAATPIQDNLQCGTTLVTDSTAPCDTKAGSDTVNNTVKNIINFFSAVVGIVSVVMIIYGGFKYISSGGDAGNVSSAKNTIIYAVIGLIVVAMAQFLVQFVLGKVITT